MRIAELKRPPRELVNCVHSDGWRLGLQVVYAPQLVEFLKASGAAWHAQSRMWVLPRTSVNGAFAQRLAEQVPSGIVFTVPHTLGLIQQALASPNPELFCEGLDVQVFQVRGGGCVLQFKRDGLLSQVAQRAGGKLLQGRGGWLLEGAVPPEVIQLLAEQAGISRDYVYLHDEEIVLHETAGAADESRPSLGVGGVQPDELPQGLAVEHAGAVLGVLVSPLQRMEVSEALLDEAQERFSLFDYQREGVKHFLSLSSALNADDMGLGKSRQSIAAAELTPGDGAVLIVCPASLKINWQREVNKVLPEARVTYAGETQCWWEGEWVVANYERLGGVVQALNDGLVRFRVMVVDEAHSLKEESSGRTRNAFLLAKRILRRYLLTATPVLNKEQEILALLRLSGHPIGDLPAAEFAEQFAGSPAVRHALRERLAEWMIRRKKDVLKGLKGKSHHLQYVQISAEDRRRYQRLLGDQEMNALVKVGQLRQLVETLKINWLIDTIRGMAPGDKTIVFTEHLDLVPQLHEELSAAGIRSVTYTGSMSKTRKQQAVDTFQSDPDTTVFIGLRKAAGVGIGLTAANWVIPVSLPWNGALRRQAEDRAYRNGQTRHVCVLIPIIPNTIDERVLALNRYKEGIEGDLLDGDDRPPSALELLQEPASSLEPLEATEL